MLKSASIYNSLSHHKLRQYHPRDFNFLKEIMTDFFVWWKKSGPFGITNQSFFNVWLFKKLMRSLSKYGKGSPNLCLCVKVFAGQIWFVLETNMFGPRRSLLVRGSTVYQNSIIVRLWWTISRNLLKSL